MNSGLLAQGFNGEPIFAIVLVLLLMGFVFGAVFLAIFSRYFWLWVQAKMTGAGVTIIDLIGMLFRRVDARTIVRGKIMSIQAGIDDPDLTTKSLEAHYLARGNVLLVIRALIAARKSRQITLSFREAAAIDLAGRDVLDAVQTSVYPKVIDCPPKGSSTPYLDAIARDGIQLKVKARVTVRANLQRLIGGATEETIIARVGQGIVSAIGSSASHNVVLENPDVISKTVLASRLDDQTAFEIVSIDIADIDVGENIGARLQADKAEADTRVARARAESRRAEAVATEQEMIARIEESRAAVVASEAEVPRAIAQSMQTGKLKIMDYYKLRNITADTEMRQSIAGTSTTGPTNPARQQPV
jgi:uncharacterized protein YqfA (UPF0365 family)